MLTMKSSESSAAASRSLFGVDSTGLPEVVTSARICPGPSVSISSDSATTGYSPITSASPRTRVRPRAMRKPGPFAGTPASSGCLSRAWST